MKNIDIGELPVIQNMDQDLLYLFMWQHIGYVRSHGKSIPLKPRKKLTPEKSEQLKFDLQCLVHQAKYALAYFDKLNEEK